MAYPCSENLPGCRVLDHDGTDQQVRLDGFRRWLETAPRSFSQRSASADSF